MRVIFVMLSRLCFSREKSESFREKGIKENTLFFFFFFF